MEMNSDSVEAFPGSLRREMGNSWLSIERVVVETDW
jgi:hypothetical protein